MSVLEEILTEASDSRHLDGDGETARDAAQHARAAAFANRFEQLHFIAANVGEEL
jgi:hypothetical protein